MPSHVLLCKRFRENGKLLKFCGRSNKVGLFVVIAVYFGGSRRGCIMIPASSNRAGWSLFQNELRNFCSGAKPVSLAKRQWRTQVHRGLIWWILMLARWVLLQ